MACSGVTLPALSSRRAMRATTDREGVPMGRLDGPASTLTSQRSPDSGDPRPAEPDPAVVDSRTSWPTDPVEILRVLYPLLLTTAGRLQPSRPQDARDLV